MHCFVYDPSYIQGNKLEKTLIEIEQKLHALGIYGPLLKIRQFDSLSLSIQQQRRQGMHTCVAIGDDPLFLQTINAIKEDKEIVVGYIPLKESPMSEQFALKTGVEGCDLISSRHIVPLHLGTMNNYFKFIDRIEIKADSASLTCDDLFTINTMKPSQIQIQKKGTKLRLRVYDQPSWWKKEAPLSTLYIADSIIFDAKSPFEMTMPPYPSMETPIEIRVMHYPHQMIMGRTQNSGS